MPKYKKFDRPELKRFHSEFDKTIAAFAKKSGVAIKLGGGSFNDSSVTFKLEVILADTASGMSAEEAIGRKSLDLEGVFFGVSSKDYGRTWKSWDDRTYRLVGIKSSRPKYPVSGVDVITGKGFKFEEDVLKKLSKVKK